jgi:GDP-4-dehydro-6-deoxy-D-mannose reductase
MNKRVVVTGVNGFVGHHLARALAAQEIEVIGISQDSQVSEKLKDIVTEYHQANLIEAWPDIQNVDAIIHLAGFAVVGPSFKRPQQYIGGNSAMVTNLCEYYLKQDKKPRIIVVSSGSIYDPKQPMPLTEDSKVGFNSPYSVSKVLVENQCTYYRGRGLDCVVVRPFNHVGPGQIQGFIIPDFYQRLMDAQDGDVIKVGNINTKRDYTDVRDIVQAYVTLAFAQNLKHSLYNVGSGKSLSGKEILELLKQIVNKNNVTFEIDPALVRPTDIPDMYGDTSRIHEELGWQPTIPLEQTIKDYVADAQQA